MVLERGQTRENPLREFTALLLGPANHGRWWVRRLDNGREFTVSVSTLEESWSPVNPAGEESNDE